MLRLLCKQPMHPSNIASEMKMSRAAVSRELKQLYERGLVDRHDGDSRTVIYSISEQGQKLISESEIDL